MQLEEQEHVYQHNANGLEGEDIETVACESTNLGSEIISILHFTDSRKVTEYRAGIENRRILQEESTRVRLLSSAPTVRLNEEYIRERSTTSKGSGEKLKSRMDSRR
jgi:hypothetical protein